MAEWIDIDGIVECAVMLLALSRIFPRKYDQRHTVMAASGCFGVFFVLNSLTIAANSEGAVSSAFRFFIYIFLTVATGVLYCCVSRKGQRPQFLVTVLFFKDYVLFVSILYKNMEDSWRTWLRSTLISSIFLYVLGVVLIVLCALICVKMSYPIRAHLSRRYWGVSTVTPLLFMLVWYVAMDLRQLDESVSYKILLCFLILVLSYFSYALFIQLSRELENQAQLQLDNQELEMEKRRMESMQDMLEQTRQARHELKNNYFYLETLLHEKKYDEMQRFFDKTVWPSFDRSEMVSTGNRLMDMILSQKMMEAREKNIPVMLDVHVPQKLQIDSRLICTLMFNLLDNALEASQKVSSPDISCEVRMTKGYLFIEVKNRIEASVLHNNPHLKTSKKDSAYHGIGMKVIRQSVAALDGNMNISEKNGCFVVRVMLPDQGGEIYH